MEAFGWILGGLGATALAALLFGYWFFRRFLGRGAHLGASPRTVEAAAEARRDLDRLSGLGLKERSLPGSGLHACLLDQDSSVTVILVHGYGTGPVSRASDGLFYAGLGYNLLLPYNRGFGPSPGKYIGMGVYEREDLGAWIEYALSRFSGRVLLDGVSMGAASVILAAAANPDAPILGVVSDCGYTAAWDAFGYRLKKVYHLPAFPILPLCNLFCRLFAGYDLRDACPLQAVKTLKMPVLFFHGEKDRLVPVSMAQQLFDACPGPKKLVLVSAGHASARLAQPQQCRQNILEFFPLNDIADGKDNA